MDYNYNFLYWLRDASSCLGVLVGVGGALFLFLRKKTLPAVLALVGFLALGLEPVLDIILWRLIAQNSLNPNYQVMDYAYVCISGPGFVLGVVLIVAAFILAFRAPKLPPPPPVEGS